MTFPCLRLSFLLANLSLGVLGCMCGCAGSPRAKFFHGDRTYTETTIAARTAFEQNRIEEAAHFYTLAMKRARALDRPPAIGDAAYNLAACRLCLKQYDRAQILLAEAAFELARSGSSLADVLLLQARAAYLADDFQAAGVFLHQLRTNPQSKPVAAHLAQAVILEGQMACDHLDWSSAADLLGQARDYLGPEADTSLQAQCAALSGRLAMGREDLRTAAKAFERQADLLRHAGRYRVLGTALARAGKAYSTLNEHAPAADRFYRAARNAAAWGDTASAKKWALAAVEAAQKADDTVIAGLAASLLDDL